jgi:hypothetical protein
MSTQGEAVWKVVLKNHKYFRLGAKPQCFPEKGILPKRNVDQIISGEVQLNAGQIVCTHKLTGELQFNKLFLAPCFAWNLNHCMMMTGYLRQFQGAVSGLQIL